ncbi:hypothetical protein [Paenibacillus ginsengarvi]|uniref:Uncharacterized protein n=1 Tax=Paenibacillus ginsengarvi TaxID=400777 RepID=A0A3B0BLV0_9BACL|nr:hypothetical protein [Paenibacillus ginsengarvi]RKN74120.1 hypothetical protein D7M11_27075 [Paenibacillus ginsengarvi]
MGVVAFLVFSASEWVALIGLMFAMFHFPLSGYRGQILLCSFLLSLLSYLLFDVWELMMLAPMVQLPIVILCVWQIFRVHVFYASVMTTFGYMGYGFVQSLYMLVFHFIGFSFVEMQTTYAAYVIQLLSIVSSLLIAYLIYKKRLGFSFIPDSVKVKVRMKGENLWLLFLCVLGHINVAMFNYLASKGIYSFLIISVILSALLYSAWKREESLALNYSHRE